MQTLQIDATGFGSERMTRIDLGLETLLSSSTYNAMFITKEVGGGMITYTTEQLASRALGAKYKFPVSRFEIWSVEDDHIEGFMARCNNGGVIVIEDAEYLEDKPNLKAALAALESPYTNIVYMTNKRSFVMASGNYTTKPKHPASLIGRFIHIEMPACLAGLRERMQDK